MEDFITVLNVIAALFMILVVLVQGGNQGGMAPPLVVAVIPKEFLELRARRRCSESSPTLQPQFGW